MVVDPIPMRNASPRDQGVDDGPVRDSDLTETERTLAHEHRDVRLPLSATPDSTPAIALISALILVGSQSGSSSTAIFFTPFSGIAWTAACPC